MKKNKIKYLLLSSYFLLITFLISCSPPPVNKPIGKPNIYHLRDTHYAHFYVFDNFQDNESCIKYLFDFAEKHQGRLIIMTNKDTYEFDDGVPFIQDTISQQFAFSREREKDEELSNKNIRNTGIRVKFHPTKLNFQIEENKNIEKIPLKKLSADFDSLSINEIQNFLDYSRFEDYRSRKESENYIYELYNKNNKLKIRQVYHGFGKWFEIKIF